MAAPVTNNVPNQQQVQNTQPLSYNAVQINMNTPTVNVDQQRPLPPTATQEWQA